MSDKSCFFKKKHWQTTLDPRMLARLDITRMPKKTCLGGVPTDSPTHLPLLRVALTQDARFVRGSKHGSVGFS